MLSSAVADIRRVLLKHYIVQEIIGCSILTFSVGQTLNSQYTGHSDNATAGVNDVRRCHSWTLGDQLTTCFSDVIGEVAELGVSPRLVPPNRLEAEVIVASRDCVLNGSISPYHAILRNSFPLFTPAHSDRNRGSGVRIPPSILPSQVFSL